MIKKKIVACCVAFALAAACCLSVGCAEQTSAEVDTTPAGAPPLMPVGHEGRYETTGANGCYGCHGANETANPMLATATVPPADHYANGDASSLTFDPNRAECQTCHAQG